MGENKWELRNKEGSAMAGCVCVCEEVGKNHTPLVLAQNVACLFQLRWNHSKNSKQKAWCVLLMKIKLAENDGRNY